MTLTISMATEGETRAVRHVSFGSDIVVHEFTQDSCLSDCSSSVTTTVLNFEMYELLGWISSLQRMSASKHNSNRQQLDPVFKERRTASLNQAPSVMTSPVQEDDDDEEMYFRDIEKTAEQVVVALTDRWSSGEASPVGNTKSKSNNAHRLSSPSFPPRFMPRMSSFDGELPQPPLPILADHLSDGPTKPLRPRRKSSISLPESLKAPCF